MAQRTDMKQKIVKQGLIGEVEEFYLSYTSGSYHGNQRNQIDSGIRTPGRLRAPARPHGM